MQNQTLLNPDFSEKKNLYWFLVPISVSLFLLSIVWYFKLNVPLFYKINHISGFTGTAIWQYFTILGDGMVSALLLTFWIKKKPQIAWSFLLATVVYMIIFHLMKEYLNFKRPPAILEPNSFYLAGKAFKKHSFPSGHTTTIFALCGVISYYYRSFKIRSFAIVLAILVGFSRVLIGIHWPADIFAGSILGWLSAGIGVYLTRKIKFATSDLPKYIFSILFFFAAIVLVFNYNTGYKDAVIFQKMIGISVIWSMAYSYYLKEKIFSNYYLFSEFT